MDPIARWIAMMLCVLLAACGSEPAPVLSSAPGPPAPGDTPVPVARVPARPPAPPSPPELRIEGPEVHFYEPRELAAIWAEVIQRREQIGELLAQERVKDIATVAQRMLLLSRELGARTAGMDELQQVELVRAGSSLEVYMNQVHDSALTQIPGALPLRLWEMDLAWVALEELIPGSLRGGASYPRPAERPPV